MSIKLNQLTNIVDKIMAKVKDKTDAIEKDIEEVSTQIDEIRNNKFNDIYTNAPYEFAILDESSDGRFAWNGMSFIQDNIVTYNGFEYFIIIDSSSNPVIIKRNIITKKYTKFDLSTIPNNPLSTPTKEDLHCTYSLAIDSNGYIHLSGNCHGEGLHYIISKNPLDITTWNNGLMIGENENAVTYPTFFKIKDDLFFTFRDGGSGNGNQYINKYVDNKWIRITMLFEGKTKGVNAYLNHIVEKNGVLKIAYCWRGTGDSSNNNANTNHDICFCQSKDGCLTWEDIDGNNISLPITEDNSYKILDTDTINSGIVNQCGFDVDSNGNPHCATFLYDSNGYTQLHHIWHDGYSWRNDIITDWKTRLETDVSILSSSISRPSLICSKNRTFVIYRNNNINKDALYMQEVTNGEKYEPFKILQLPLYDYEFTYDTEELKNNILKAIIVPCKVYGSIYSENYNTDANWNKQFTAILKINMNQIDFISNKNIELPYFGIIKQFEINDKEIDSFTELYYSELLRKNLYCRVLSNLSGEGNVYINDTSMIKVSESKRYDTAWIRLNNYIKLTIDSGIKIKQLNLEVAEIKGACIYTEKDETVKYLYCRGNEYSNITGGWNVYLGSNDISQIIKNENSLFINGITEHWNFVIVNNKINLTNYSKLCMKYSKSINTSYQTHRTAIKIGNTISSWEEWSDTNNGEISIDDTNTTVSNGILELNLKDITGEWYVGAGSCNNNSTIYEIWLE